MEKWKGINEGGLSVVWNRIKQNFVSSIGFANNQITWSKGGVAQTPFTVGYASSAGKLNTNAGSTTNPVYFANGVPVACTYSLNKTVPADAVFTDTNTHRPIQLNGTEILGNNTTALNLKAGTGVSLTNSSGTVTFNNSGVRAATINGNYLRINTNGTNADLTIPYATNANFANVTHKIKAQTSLQVNSSNKNKYRKFGTITITKRYTLTEGTLQYYSELSTSNNNASTGFLYINAYQQDELGQSAEVTFEQLGDTKRFKFYAVEQVSSTSTVIDIYVTIEVLYHGISIVQISGNLSLSDGGSWLDELPEGTRTIEPSFTARVGYADKLTTARTINGTSFDGTANITTANWGTARNISIADSDSTNTGAAVSVNGSAAVTLKLPATIKATLSGNATSATKATNDSDGNAINTTYLKVALKGAANGLAELDANGLVPSSQLPSYVDDVLEYASKSAFPATGTAGKIYVTLDTNLTYRWSGSAYTEISPSLALGETSSTAYRGDRGKTAYTHATDASRLTTAKSSGFYKFATTAEGHIASVTAVTTSDITSLIGSTTYAPYNANGYLPLSGGTMTGTLTGTTIYATNVQPRRLLINHVTADYKDSSVRGCIGYLTSSIPDTCATPTDRGYGIYFSAGSDPYNSRIVLTALSGIYLDSTVYLNGTALSSAATHAHTDYVTAITWDSTNRKLKQSKGDGTATDIVTFGAAYSYGVYDKSTAAESSGTGLVTERALYYALPTINGGHSYKSSDNIYAPTGAGSSGQILKSSGSGAPTWVNQSTITAGALTTVSKTAWGRTFWTANGVPDSISGNMDNVGIISINNQQGIRYKKYQSDAFLRVLVVSGDDNLYVGPYASGETCTTYIYGNPIIFRTKDANNAGVLAATIDANKNFTSQGSVVGMQGVAAYGIADLSIISNT